MGWAYKTTKILDAQEMILYRGYHKSRHRFTVDGVIHFSLTDDEYLEMMKKVPEIANRKILILDER